MTLKNLKKDFLRILNLKDMTRGGQSTSVGGNDVIVFRYTYMYYVQYLYYELTIT